MTTIKTTISQPVSGSATVAAAARRVAGAFAAAWTVYRNRRQLRRLAELDDYLLADMGLSRADVEAAAVTPFYTDPTAKLATTSDLARVANPRLGDARRGRLGG